MRKYSACLGFFTFIFSTATYAQSTNPALSPTPFLPAKTAATVVLKTPAGLVGQANGLKTGAIILSVDTSIRVNPKMAYLSIDFSNITGSSMDDILNGNNLFWVYDKAGKPVPIADRFLKKVNAAMENTTVVNMTVKIPYRLKTDKNIYTIRYRWESKDKLRNLDMLTSK